MKRMLFALLALSLTLSTACSFQREVSRFLGKPESEPETADTTTQPAASEADKTTEELKQNSESEQAPQDERPSDAPADDDRDFVIQDNVLIAYEGVASHVIIPDGVTKIDDYAFWSVDHLEAVEVPASVKEVGDCAFWSCAGLKFVHFEEGLETIGSTAFWSCPSLSDVNLPASAADISWDAFANCAALTLHVTEGSPAEAFAEQEGIPYDYTPASYEPSTEKTIHAAQYEYSEFTEFIIEDDVTAIGACAFQYCENLTFIDIPHSVKTIGGDAFEYCSSLEAVNIWGCTEIGDGAFEYCRELSDVIIMDSTTYIAKSAFDYCDEDLTIHCPAGSYAEQYAIAMQIPYDHEIQ